MSLDFDALIEEAQQKRQRLWENPPPCGPVIRYAEGYGYEESCGEFLFKWTDVEQALRTALRENPHLVNDDEGDILNWVQGCDEALAEPTDVPSIWSRFKYVADDLIRAGKVEIYCRKCGTTIQPYQIAANDDRNQPSWNMNRVVGPHGHNLLVVEAVHLMIN